MFDSMKKILFVAAMAIMSIGAFAQQKFAHVNFSELVQLTGLDERIIRRRIHKERTDGFLIVSDNIHGYFLAENVDDVKRFVRSMMTQIHL